MVFWGVTYATPFVWGFLLIVGILKFEFGWLIVVVVAIVLSSSNVYGYWKCSSEQKGKFQQMFSRGAQMGVSSAIQHNVLGKISQLASSARLGSEQQQNQAQPGMTFA